MEPELKKYPAIFQVVEDGITVTFPDLDEAITCGYSMDEARKMAAEVLKLTLEGRAAEGLPIPEPSSVLVEIVTPGAGRVEGE